MYRKTILILILSTVLATSVLAEVIAKHPLNPLGRPYFPQVHKPFYLLWQDFNGWHLRWSTPERTFRFSGQIATKDGIFGKVKGMFPYLKKKEYITESQIIRFDLSDNKKINGFDFRTNAKKLKIKLFINGKGCVDCIYIGASATHPKNIPFKLLPIQPGIQRSGR